MLRRYLLGTVEWETPIQAAVERRLELPFAEQGVVVALECLAK